MIVSKVADSLRAAQLHARSPIVRQQLFLVFSSYKQHTCSWFFTWNLKLWPQDKFLRMGLLGVRTGTLLREGSTCLPHPHPWWVLTFLKELVWVPAWKLVKLDHFYAFDHLCFFPELLFMLPIFLLVLDVFNSHLILMWCICYRQWTNIDNDTIKCEVLSSNLTPFLCPGTPSGTPHRRVVMSA